MEAVASLAPFLLIAVLFWLLLIRPAQRRQREAQNVQRAATVGSEVMLTSGIFGTVASEDDDTLQIEVAPGTVMKVARGAIAKVVVQEPASSEHSESEESGVPSATDADHPEGQ
jgi:preprotein translocase subunit YajC